MTRERWILIGVMLLLSSACGSSSGGAAPAGDGGSGPDTARVCNDVCEKRKTCSFSSSLCSKCPVTMAHWRAKALQDFDACLPHACSDDAFVGCVATAVVAEPERDIDGAFQKSCLASQDTCKFQGDACKFSALYTDAAVGEAAACLSKPCESVLMCIKGALGG